MAITAYVGLQGHGKTYEVVTEVILPALASGRRVVSNVRGLQWDEMRAYLMEKGSAQDAIGEGVSVTSDDVGKADFFCSEAKEGAVVRPGDLVVIDECWRWWGPGMAVPPAHREFFRMHRHFVDDKGVSCDLVLIAQDIEGIDRKLRVLVEKRFRMVKQKKLGLSNWYRVELREGYKANSPVLREFTRKYNPAFFAFYSSYAGKGGDEREVDRRFNVFGGPLFRIVMPLAAGLILFGGWYLWSWFSSHGAARAKEAKAGAVAAGEIRPAGVGGGVSAGGASPSPAWRVVGLWRAGDRLAVLVNNGEMSRELRSEPMRFSEFNVEVLVDGKVVTSYSGPGHLRSGGGAGSGLGGSGALAGR